MPTRRQVAASEAIQRRTGATVHFATRLLPERVRHPTYVLRGFSRIADEVVDDAGDASPAEQRAGLAAATSVFIKQWGSINKQWRHTTRGPRAR